MSGSFPIVVASSGVSLCMFWLLVPLAIFFLYAGYTRASRKLLLEHTPTTDCGGVSPGRVELKAESVAEDTLDSPLTDKKVVYYKYRIEENQSDESGSDNWVEVASGERSRPFYVHDDTGRVRVDPKDAEFHADTVVEQTVSSNHSLFERGPKPHPAARQRKLYEEHIAVDEDIYIFGTARSRAGLGIPEVYAGNGDEPYIISTVDESYLADKFGSQAAIAFWIGGIAAVLLPILGMMAIGEMPFEEAVEVGLIPTFVIGLGVVGVIWALRRMSHSEHLTDLRKRTERAESILRRECHHRERLMARIVNAARLEVGYSDRKKLDAIAERRKKAYSDRTFKNVRRLCPMVDEQSEALDELFRIVEQYDKFQSDEDFYELLEELTRCEKQIMMARNFYNDAVWRLNQQPESLVGETRVGRSSGVRALTFKEFEKKPIEVVLPEDPDDEYGRESSRGDARSSPESKGASSTSAPSKKEEKSESDELLSALAARAEAAVVEEMDRGLEDGARDSQKASEKPPHSEPDSSTQEEGDSSVEHEQSDSTRVAVDDSAEIVDVAGDTPSFEPQTEAFSSSMSFDDGPTMEGIGDFGDIGRFGSTRRFDELGGGDDEDGADEESEGQAHFGFSRGERASLSSTEWDSEQRFGEKKSFGFSDDDRTFGFGNDEKSVLEAFADDDELKKSGEIQSGQGIKER